MEVLGRMSKERKVMWGLLLMEIGVGMMRVLVEMQAGMVIRVLVEMEIEVVMMRVLVEMEVVMVDQEMKDGWERRVQVEMEPQLVMEVSLVVEVEQVVGV